MFASCHSHEKFESTNSSNKKLTSIVSRRTNTAKSKTARLSKAKGFTFAEARADFVAKTKSNNSNFSGSQRMRVRSSDQKTKSASESKPVQKEVA